MPRKPKSSPMEDLFVIVARLPWWGGVAAAIISYLVLHAFAAPGVRPTAAGSTDVAGQMLSTMVRTIATFAQVVVPIVCLFAAGVSAVKARQRSSLVTTVASSAASSLNDMSWVQFEQLVGEGFRLQGYTVVETGGVGVADGGVDLLLSRGRETFIVQCKQWRAFKVGVDVVRELFGVMAARGAAGGFVVTSGTFTLDAIKFASGRNVTLIDGPKLHNMIRRAHASMPSAPVPPPTSRPGSAETPSCPICHSTMVRRQSRKGAMAGTSFWGCPRYPTCRGTRPITADLS